MNFSLFVAPALATMLFAAAPVQASTITFTDNFEAGSIDPFWSLTQQNGNIQLSSAQSVSGTQSAQLNGTGGGQVDVWLTHAFAQSTQGTISVQFFDTGTGTYAGLYAFDSAIAANDYASNVADYAPGYGSPYIWHGPGVTETPTSVLRTPGWHKLELRVLPTGFTALVDSTVTGFVAGNFTFDTVRLLVSGPSRVGTSYFDDFSVSYESADVVPEPGSIVLLGTALLATGSARWSKRRRQ